MIPNNSRSRAVKRCSVGVNTLEAVDTIFVFPSWSCFKSCANGFRTRICVDNVGQIFIGMCQMYGTRKFVC